MVHCHNYTSTDIKAAMFVDHMLFDKIAMS